MEPEALVEEIVPLRDGELTVLRPRDNESLIDEQAFEQDEFLPFWAELWPSARALARRLDGRAFHGARVVELGCGLGVPSLAAARAGARVLATDWSENAIVLLADNAQANGLALETARIDWAYANALVARGPFDLVLASDVLYERRNVSLLLRLLPRLGREVWLSDPGRAFADLFLEQIPRLWSLDTVRVDRVFVHRLRRLSPGPS